MEQQQKSILIDAFNLGLEAGTGIATYARNLSHSVHRLGYRTDILYATRAASANKLLREIAFFDPTGVPASKVGLAVRYARQFSTSVFGVKALGVPISGQVISTTYKSRLPYFDQIWNSPDVYRRAERYYYMVSKRMKVRIPGGVSLAHWTYPLPIYVPGAKNIYTMHDLVPLRLPYTTLDNKRRYFNLMRTLCRTADHIVTVSETSKNDIINLLGISPDRVTNTYQAVEVPDKYANKPEHIVKTEIEGTLNLKYKNYFLFFGAIEPKKNIGRLIEAYLSSGVSTPLVVLGKLAWKSEQELRLLNDDTIKYLETVGTNTITRSRVMRVDYVPYPLLVSLIRGAKSVLFPSLYEGFGLPVLEAMKLGTPVLTSTEGSTPEVAGNGAMLVDPYDVRAMADGIIALDSDENLRGDLAVRGRAQTEQFSVERYEARLKELYGRLIGQGR